MENQVEKYIRKNIGKTVKEKQGMKPFTVPCIYATFTDFYYWDTYFTNLALLELGNFEQVENNLDNMKAFVEKLGYIPNADIATNRSQPPLFSRSVYDYYVKAGRDLRIAEKYLPAMIGEHAFWQKERRLPCGLNGYASSATDEFLLEFFEEIADRVGVNKNACLDKVRQGAHFLAIAESGWDFTPRFHSEGNRYAGLDYAPIDLNCILYNAEKIIAELTAALGKTSVSVEFEKLSEERKNLINRYMTALDGTYYDYNIKEKRHSAICSAASFFPYAVGISESAEGSETVLARLEAPYGVTACEKREDDRYDQWDYPYMWAPLVYFCAEALRITGSERFRSVAEKYLTTVENVFAETGVLWEKYDAVTGEVARNHEYDTPSMLGWTAGVYLYLKNIVYR